MRVDGLILVRPSRDMQQALWAYRAEFLTHGEKRINGSCGLAFFDSFEEWLAVATSIVKQKLSREGVHASTFFLIRVKDEKVLGSVQIRHSLTPELLLHGGHIGYAIRPTERGRGYGKQQLMLALGEAKKLVLPRVMISCDQENTPSSRTIRSCGGVLEKEMLFQDKLQQVFWLETGLSGEVDPAI